MRNLSSALPVANFSAGFIGIDLGTANTLVCTPEKGVIIREPSYVAYNIKTEEKKAEKTKKLHANVQPLRAKGLDFSMHNRSRLGGFPALDGGDGRKDGASAKLIASLILC